MDTAELTDGRLQVSGGKDEAVQQPLWLSDGSLAFVSDRESGWWNLWRETSPGHIKPTVTKDAEFGYPPWIFGYHTYAELPDGRWAILAVPLQACWQGLLCRQSCKEILCQGVKEHATKPSPPVQQDSG